MNSAGPRSVSVFGVRGAFPVTGTAFSEFGGNTSCIAVDCGEDLFVLDAGSGIVGLGTSLAGMSRFRRIHILLGHLHFDHIQGLMGFAPLFDAGAEIHIYGEGHRQISFRECISRVLGPPYWPISIEDVPSRPILHELGPGTSFQNPGGLTLETHRGCHPNGSLLFRIEDDETSVVYALDCELTEGFLPRLAGFAQGCSLLVWDANYTEADLKHGWGHSTWKQGIHVAKSAGAERVLMTHYDRNYTDELLREQEQLAKQADDSCLFAREGMVINL